MSDLRSEAPPPDTWRLKVTRHSLINTNGVLQKAFRQLGADEKNKIILRCEDLPYVQGNDDDFENIFSRLLKLIVESKQVAKRLFLHIHCTTDETVTAGKGLKRISIQLKTNLAITEDWKKIHDQEIMELISLLQRHEAIFTVNEVKNGGCIFSVSLPGKPF